LIDPGDQTVLIFMPNQLPQIFDEPQQVLIVPTFANELTLTVGELFAWLWE
jgi:Uma2 family endonuclease